MDTNAIARLLRPYAKLTAAQLAQTLRYLNLLVKWNAKVNLTAVRSPEETVTRHFGESFFAAARLVSSTWAGAAIDVGSGAGFPGLPLAMFAPDAEVTLIEANNKKAAFLNEVIFALQLKNAKVFADRAENYPERGQLVTVRAVEKFEKSLPVALNLVVEGGRLALMIGSAQVDVARKFATGVEWQEPEPVPGGHSRVLLVGTKVAGS
ncbi:MAG: 16S rRNA (guanine(527)-N(7))-methyltransferase RsmG [Acidobacteriia bacterium]|nr:16S rRNA (guanine(527)-N(7))-methyltransferase RsmG [Terriglobia bacterium]